MSSSSSTKSRSEQSHCSDNFGQSNINFDYEGPALYCNCGLKAPLVTSMSDENPERRFFGCNNYKVRGCNFFVWHDSPIENQHVKALLIELRNRNKQLFVKNSVLKNENRCLNEMVAALKVENEYLRNICSSETKNELFDEMATLKAEIEVAQSKVKAIEIKSRREVKAQNIYKYILTLKGLLLLYKVAYGSEGWMEDCVLAFP